MSMEKGLMELKEEASNQTDSSLLILRIDECMCALSLFKILELVLIPKLLKPLGMSTVLEGFLNVEGRAVPVLQPRVLFGLPPLSLALFTPLILFGVEKPEFAFAVDAVEDIVFVEKEEIAALDAHHSFNGCVNGEIRMNGTYIPILDLDRMLRQEEHQRIREWQVIGQNRLEEFQCGEGAPSHAC